MYIVIVYFAISLEIQIWNSIYNGILNDNSNDFSSKIYETIKFLFYIIEHLIANHETYIKNSIEITNITNHGTVK